jgi:hypothetical protein
MDTAFGGFAIGKQLLLMKLISADLADEKRLFRGGMASNM